MSRHGREVQDKWCGQEETLVTSNQQSVVNLFSNGILRSSGVIFVALMEVEHEGRLVSSLPFSIIGLSSMIAGPITGYLESRMSYRVFVCLAQSLVVFGQLACYFTTAIYALTFFMFIRNCGCIFLYTYLNKLLVILFPENRATASGVASLGIPFGGFLWPYLMDHFIQSYGLRGSFMLSAGVALHAFIPILLVSCFLSKEVNSDLRQNENKLSVTRKHSTQDFNSKGKVELNDTENVNSSFQKNEDSSDFESKRKENKESFSDSKYEDNLSDLNEQKCDLQVKKTHMDNSLEKTSPSSKKSTLYRVLSSRVFYLLTLSASFNGFFQTIFYQVIVDYMHDKGAETDVALSVISSFTFGAIVGRVGLGWISDKNFMSLQIYQAIILSIAASSLLIATFVQIYYLQIVFYFITGSTQGFIAVGTMTYFGECFEKHEVLVALSSQIFILGFFQLARTPVLGLFRDYLMNYDYLFETVSILFYTLALLWIYEHYILKKQKKDYMSVSTEDKEDS